MFEKMNENLYGRIGGKPSMMFEIESLAVNIKPSLAKDEWMTTSVFPYYDENYKVTDGSIELLTQVIEESKNMSIVSNVKTI